MFDNKEHFVISSITFKELENIKTSNYKDSDTKYRARLLLNLLQRYPENYEVIIHDNTHLKPILHKQFDITDDMRILSDAIWCNDNKYADRTVFVTNDLALYNIANLFFGNKMIEMAKEEQDNYTGYQEITVNCDELADFYQDMTINHFNLNIGEYLILYTEEQENDRPTDIRVWDGYTHRNINTKPFNSKQFGRVKPYNNDLYQKLLFDSL